MFCYIYYFSFFGFILVSVEFGDMFIFKMGKHENVLEIKGFDKDFVIRKIIFLKKF